jgi:oligo-1,6-glucosidase
MNFWLKRGTSGFRMDVINLISKVQTFPDAEISIPGKRWQPGNKHYANGPRMHEYLKEIKTEVLDKYDTMTVGEMPWVSDEAEIIRVVNQKDGELNMIFIFDICEISIQPGQDRFSLREWTIDDLKKLLNKYQSLMIDRNGWNSLFLENHDLPRSVSTFGKDTDEWREKSAKLLALMHTTLAGTVYVYQGEELGMRNVPLSWSPDEYKDIESMNWWKKYGPIPFETWDQSC